MTENRPTTTAAARKRATWLRSWRFWLVAIAVFFLLVSVAGFFLLRPEMSRRAKAALVEQLKTATGGEVEIGEVDFYPGTIIANDVKLYEVGGDRKLFAKFGRVEIGFSILSTFDTDLQPTGMKLIQSEVNLRFDAIGNLLNEIHPPPAETETFQLPIDRIWFYGTVNIEQEGRDSGELQYSNIRVLQIDDSIDFIGTSTAFKTVWSIDGGFNSQSGDFQIHLSSDKATTTAKQLWRQPFLPQIDESFVDFGGTSKVDLQFGYAPDKGIDAFHYRVELDPDGIDLAIPIGGVYFTKFRGGVLIEDHLITATKVHADWIGGWADVNGTFDYSVFPLVGDLNVRCGEATIAKFPRLWSLPEFVAGKLDAEGRLGLSVSESATALDAEATGVVKQLDVNGLVADHSRIDINLNQLSVPADISPQNPVIAEGKLQLWPQIQSRPADQLVSDFCKMIDLPVPAFADQLAGKVNVKCNLNLPLATIDDWRTYQCFWTTDAAQLSIQNLDLTNLLGHGRLDSGVVHVDSIEAETNGGQVLAKAGIDPNAAQLVDADVKVRECDLQQLKLLAGAEQANVSGALSADLKVRVANDGQWQVDGGLRSKQLNADTTTLRNVAIDIVADVDSIALQNGQATNDDFDLSVSTATIRLDGESGRRLEAKFRMQNIDLAKQLAKTSALDEALIIPEPLTIEGGIHPKDVGGGDWLDSLSISGNGTLPSVSWKNAIARDVRFNWSWLNGQLSIQDAKARALNGTLAFETAVPLDGWREIRDAKISFNDIDLAQVAKLVDAALPLQGKANGELTLSELNSEQPVIEMQFENSTMSSDALRLTNLSGNASLRDGKMTLESSGKMFDGTFRFDGEAPWSDVQKGQLAGKLSLQQMDLRRLAAESPRFAELQSLSGKLGGSFDFRFDKKGQLQGDGNVQVEQVSWSEQLIVESVGSKVSIQDGVVRVRGLEARFGRGSGSGRLTYDLQRRQPGTFELNLSRVDLAKLGNEFVGLKEWESGESDLRLAGKIGNSIEGRGRLGSRRVKAFGIEADSVRSDFQFRYQPRSRSGSIESSNIAMKVAEGQVRGSAKYAWGSNPQLKVQAKLDRLNARRMIRSTSLKSTLQRGQVSGQLKLSGRNVRSFKDLQGSFRGNLKQTEALRLPVLQDVARVAATGRVSNVPFDSDQLQLTLSQGAITVKQMSLNGDLAQLTIDGVIRPGQRLDLNVAVHLGQSQVDQQISRLISLGVVAGGGGLPLAVLAEANDLLSERLVYLKVGGTVQRPRVKLQADRQLGQEVALFFLNNSFGGKIRLGNLR